MPSSSPDVIELLEDYLEAAKKNVFDHCAIVMCGHPNVAAIDVRGDISLEPIALEAAKSLHNRLATSVRSWTLPVRDDGLREDHVVYNLANGPLGYDFVVWLVDAVMTMRRAGLPGPLRVGFWLGLDATDRMNKDQRRMWLSNVFRPALALVGAVEDPVAIRGHHKNVFVSRDIVAAAKKGEEVPRLRTPETIVADDAVTITLRESSHWDQRNSDVESWTRFARWLKNERGERVIFVRDTSKAKIPLVGFRTCPEASESLLARASLYATAKANLFVSNGPATLALFGDKPWLQFVPLEKDEGDYAYNTRKFWRESMGVEPDREQYPWSNHLQRIVWARDSYDNLVSAWDALNLSQ